VRRWGGRKDTLRTRVPMTVPQGPNQRWSFDYRAPRATGPRASTCTWTRAIASEWHSGGRWFDSAWLQNS
jgi:hypothetical protein